MCRSNNILVLWKMLEVPQDVYNISWVTLVLLLVSIIQLAHQLFLILLLMALQVIFEKFIIPKVVKDFNFDLKRADSLSIFQWHICPTKTMISALEEILVIAQFALHQRLILTLKVSVWGMYAYNLDVSHQNLKLISFVNFSVSINAASKSALGTDCTTDYLLVSFTSHMHKVECTLFRKSCLIKLTFVKRVPLQKKC